MSIWLRLVLLALLPAALLAQADSAAASGAEDAVIQRARQLAEEGHETEGRAVLDSLISATSPAHPVYADALYWRGMLAPSAAEARRAYERILIETPMSARAPDAHLQLAQILEARGDRDGAEEHLRRFLLAADSTARPQAALTLVRMVFEDNDLPRACDALRLAVTSVPAGDVEARNRLDYFRPRCTGVAAASAANDTAAGRAPLKPPFWSVQVAAYDSAAPAARLVRTLADRGITARVDGRARPYRVRVGRFATRADAVKAAAALKQKGQDGFVTHVTTLDR